MFECMGHVPPVSQGDIWARIRAEALRGALQLPALRRGEFLCGGWCGRSRSRENGRTGMESGSAAPWVLRGGVRQLGQLGEGSARPQEAPQTAAEGFCLR